MGPKICASSIIDAIHAYMKNLTIDINICVLEEFE